MNKNGKILLLLVRYAVKINKQTNKKTHHVFVFAWNRILILVGQETC